MRLLHCHSAKQRFRLRSLRRSRLAAKHELLCALGLVAAIAFFGGVSLCGAGGKGGPPRAILTHAEPETGEMDPRLAEALNAFGASRYEECRRLAVALAVPVGRGLRAPPPDSTRAEAVGLIILSHLHQGDFVAAREAAERLRSVSADVCQDLLARVNREERDYQAEVSRLQRIVATTKDPQEGARAQLWTARAHQRAGRLELAEQSYRKLVERHPLSVEAGPAFAHLAIHQWQEGDCDGTIAACERAIDRAPDGPLGARACWMLSERFAEPRAKGYEATRQRLSAIAARHPGTEAADIARFGIGQLYLAQGIPELAEREWAALISERPHTPVAAKTRTSLAHLRYEVAAGAAPGDVEKGIRYMRLAADSPDPQDRLRALQRLAAWQQRVGDFRGARESYLECARLATHSPAKLRSLGRAANCLVTMGMVEEAISEYEDLLAQTDLPEELAEGWREELAAAKSLLSR